MSSDIEFAAIIEQVARQLLGEPNHHLSTTSELRFGTHGSLAVTIVLAAAGMGM